MARKSRRLGVTHPPKNTECAKLLRTAAYARLSVERETEESLETQMALLHRFIEEHEDLQLEESYCDNGYSGTDFDRPAFSLLMEDVKCGRIECIVVKDLSRLGRDYVETGYYIEGLFPQWNVRFIAVTDGFDSLRDGDRSGMALPIRNMINAMYARDISKKICVYGELRRKRSDAMPMGTPPFGYVYAENRRGYCIDVEDAPTVRVIFAFARMGLSCGEIASRLNLVGVATPGESRRRKCGGLPSDAVWRSENVHKILTHPVYRGDICVGRIRQAFYRGEPRRRTSPEEWSVRTHAHEPFVTAEDHYRILDTIRAHRKENADGVEKSVREEMRDVFRGMIYCSHCGRKMRYVRYQHGSSGMKKEVGCYVCSSREEDSPCGGQVIYEDFLKIFTMDQIRLLIKAMCDRRKIRNAVNTSRGGKDALLSAQKKLLAFRVRKEEVDESSLSAEVCDGLKAREMRLEQAVRKYSEIVHHSEHFLDNCEFNENLVHHLVERLSVSYADGIEITFRCTDVYRKFLSDRSVLR